jgi:hypothetical protein
VGTKRRQSLEEATPFSIHLQILFNNQLCPAKGFVDLGLTVRERKCYLKGLTNTKEDSIIVCRECEQLQKLFKFYNFAQKVIEDK